MVRSAPSLSVERGRHGTITELGCETRLSALGWTAELDAAFAPFERNGLRAGRLASDFGVALRVVTAFGEEQAALAPDLYRQARRGERPVVGDWVALAGESGPPRIVERLARRSMFIRRGAGTEQAAREQVIAANVDTGFVVTDPRDFNVRRLERYLAIVREAGAEAVIVLTKLDLHPDLPDLRSDLHALAGGMAICPVSSETGAGFEQLDRYLGRGRTICLLGSSGVGKSTLVNHLLGHEHLRTRPQRRGGAGRHTTTHRELVSLPGGALLIDTLECARLGSPRPSTGSRRPSPTSLHSPADAASTTAGTTSSRAVPCKRRCSTERSGWSG
jgi:ribosome biogenesis GTPase